MRKLHEQCVTKSASNLISTSSTKSYKLNLNSSCKVIDKKKSKSTENSKTSLKNNFNEIERKLSNTKHQKKSKKYDNEETSHKKIKKSNDSELEATRVLNYWWPSAQNESKNDNTYNLQQHHRKELRTFRIERIFTGPNGERFVFGVYYARPHETFCDSSRMFYKNEVRLL